jgi:hypothetical protein
MFRSRLLLIFAFLFAWQLFANTQSAHAYAYESSHTHSCSNFSINGTSDAPYVTVSIYNGNQLFLDIFPVTNGSYSVNVNFAEQAAGSTINYSVWGNTSASDPWSANGGAMVQIDEPCSYLPLPPYVSLLSSSMRCNSYTASAWSTAAYIGFEIRTTSGALLATGKVAANGTTVSINATFARQSSNAYLQYRLWPSSSSDVTTYDGSSGSVSGTRRCASK